MHMLAPMTRPWHYGMRLVRLVGLKPGTGDGELDLEVSMGGKALGQLGKEGA
jgi:hypothetical protein